MDLHENERNPAQSQIRKILGVGRFKRTPDGFDPIKASPRELLVHGYPARPDAKLHPRLHEQWTQTMSRPIRMIEPQFAAIRDKAHGSRQTYGLPAGNGWGGSVAFAAKGDAVTFVSGQWTVPHIVQPKPGDCICACWIGIDGANDDPNQNDSYDILQVGTTQVIVTNEHWYGDSTDYYSFAWFQWFNNDPNNTSTEITNFQVSPGDIMYCVICTYSPTMDQGWSAGIHLLNLTTGVGTAFPMTAPSGVQLVGNCAEWVVEDPPSTNMNLGRFGDVYFDECVAGTQGGQLLTAGGGTLLPMYDVNGHNIATPEVETDLVIKIRYTDAAP